MDESRHHVVVRQHPLDHQLLVHPNHVAVAQVEIVDQEMPERYAEGYLALLPLSREEPRGRSESVQRFWQPLRNPREGPFPEALEHQQFGHGTCRLCLLLKGKANPVRFEIR